jgi:G6PDH family F420-dependent oxidoreductase
VGSGENLNEHVVSPVWPSAAVRQDRLAEAIGCIRKLWEGGSRSWRGEHFTVENARVYDLPEEPVPIYVAAAGTNAASLAAELGDGLIGVAPEAEVIGAYEEAGGRGPRYGQLHVCWAEDPQQAARTAFEVWPNVAIPGELGQELPLPRHFEQAAQTLREEDVAGMIPTGPDPEPYLDAIRAYQEAGFDHVYLHQIGHDQEGFVRFAQAELLPKLG